MYFQRVFEFIIKILKQIETGPPIKGDCKTKNSKSSENITSIFINQINAVKKYIKIHFNYYYHQVY